MKRAVFKQTVTVQMHSHNRGIKNPFCEVLNSNSASISKSVKRVAKMAKDIGMTIRKGIVVPFLPCLVAFWGFHPYMFFHFFLCFFVTCFCCFLGEEKGMRCLDGVVVWAIM